MVFYTARDNERAIPLLEAARDGLPKAEPAREYLAAAYADRGQQVEAEQEAEAARLFPDSNLTYYSYLYDYWREEDLRHHLTGLRKAGIPEWPFGFEDEKPIGSMARSLRDLVDDKTWTGKHKNGTDFIQYFDKAGNTAYRSANTNITGRGRIEDDRLCESFEGYFLDHTACGYVFRNTHPTRPGGRAAGRGLCQRHARCSQILLARQAIYRPGRAAAARPLFR